jgi:hypothetical protein
MEEQNKIDLTHFVQPQLEVSSVDSGVVSLEKETSETLQPLSDNAGLKNESLSLDSNHTPNARLNQELPNSPEFDTPSSMFHAQSTFTVLLLLIIRFLMIFQRKSFLVY